MAKYVAGFITGTPHQVDITNGPGSITISLPQDIDITSSPNFDGLTVNSIDCSGILSSGDIKTTANIVGNQLIGTGLTSGRLVGVGNEGVLKSLTITSNNGVVVDISGETLTIDTPQDLQTTKCSNCS